MITCVWCNHYIAMLFICMHLESTIWLSMPKMLNRQMVCIFPTVLCHSSWADKIHTKLNRQHSFLCSRNNEKGLRQLAYVQSQVWSVIGHVRLEAQNSPITSLNQYTPPYCAIRLGISMRLAQFNRTTDIDQGYLSRQPVYKSTKYEYALIFISSVAVFTSKGYGSRYVPPHESI